MKRLLHASGSLNAIVMSFKYIQVRSIFKFLFIWVVSVAFLKKKKEKFFMVYFLFYSLSSILSWLDFLFDHLSACLSVCLFSSCHQLGLFIHPSIYSSVRQFILLYTLFPFLTYLSSSIAIDGKGDRPDFMSSARSTV